LRGAAAPARADHLKFNFRPGGILVSVDSSSMFAPLQCAPTLKGVEQLAHWRKSALLQLLCSSLRSGANPIESGTSHALHWLKMSTIFVKWRKHR